MKIDLSKIEGFEWDEGNLFKNKARHNVDSLECEQIFFNKPLIIFADAKHSSKEKRFGALGKTSNNRLLAIFFTYRKNLIRVISARDQGKKDCSLYEGKKK